MLIFRGGGIPWDELTKTITVDNTVRTASVDLSTGIATPDGNTDRNVVMNPESGDTYRAVVVPQTVAAGKSIIGITIDGVTYHYNRSEGMTYTAGKLHNFTIKVDRKPDGGGYALTLLSEDLTDWEADKSSHDFEANSYLVVNVPVAGTLKECVRATGSDFTTVRNLKVTGQLTDEDFRFMREDMSMLAAVNLKETKMVNVECVIPQSDEENYWDWPREYMDDVYPNNAFADKETLRRIILPENITVIGERAFSHLRLTSTVIIPESVKRIGQWAFDSMSDEATIIWPNSLEYIEGCAFYGCAANFEFKLNNNITHIGGHAFWRASGATGTFNIPTNLTYLGENAFAECGHDLEGDIEIPVGLKEIPYGAFSGLNFKNGTNLTLPEGVIKIGNDAFNSLKFNSAINFPESLISIGGAAFKETTVANGAIKLPKHLKYIGRHAFACCNIKGTLEFPSSLDCVLGGEGDNSGAFCGTNIDRLIIGDNILQIEARGFAENSEIKYLEIGKNVSFIGDEAFSNEPQLQTIVCKAKTPPTMGKNVFQGIYWGVLMGVYFDKVILEVPEESVDAYRHADGWKDFQNIVPHHELAFNIPDIVVLIFAFVKKAEAIRREGVFID